MPVSIGCGGDRAAEDADPAVSEQWRAELASDDVVVEFTSDDIDRAAVQKLVDGLENDPGGLTEYLKFDLLNSPMALPEDPLDNWVDFDGRVEMTPAGLAVIIPQEEVRAEWDWWKKAISLLVGAGLGFLAYGICFAAFAEPYPPLATVLCSVVRGFVAGFSASLVLAKLKGEPIDRKAWLNALSDGVIGALVSWAYDGGVKDWLQKSFAPLWRKISIALMEAAASVGRWAGATAAAGVRAVADELAAMSAYVWPAIAEAARRAGIPMATARLRVMPMGDSITYGIGSSTTSSYRADLLRDLTGQGHTVDYVGSQNSGRLTDTDNEGHSGWEISQLTGIARSTVAAYRPNVVTLNIGSNDLNNNTDVAGAPGRLARLIDEILAASPDTSVIVGTVVANSNPTVQGRINTFNTQAAQLVTDRQDAGKHVQMTDMGTLTTADLADGLHPNDAGYTKMATAFRLGVQAAVEADWVTAPQPPATSAGCTVPRGWIPKNRIASGVGADSAHIRFADINGDGRDDYLVLDDDGAVDAWINNGGDTPGGPPGWIKRGRIASGVGSYPAQIQFADINGDGRDDYLVVTTGGTVNAWINNGGDTPGGPPGWIKRGQIASGVGSGSLPIRFADIDGDGRDDYLVLQRDNSVLAWINKGGDTPGGPPGWYQRGQIASGITTTSRIDFADVDGDGRDDYLTINATGAVKAWINKGGDTPGGPPGWYERGQIASGTGAPGDQVRFGDMNAGDYMDDYLVLKPDGVLYAWQNNCGDPA